MVHEKYTVERVSEQKSGNANQNYHEILLYFIFKKLPGTSVHGRCSSHIVSKSWRMNW